MTAFSNESFMMLLYNRNFNLHEKVRKKNSDTKRNFQIIPLCIVIGKNQYNIHKTVRFPFIVAENRILNPQ